MTELDKAHIMKVDTFAVFLDINLFGSYLHCHELTLSIGHVFAKELSDVLLSKIHTSEYAGQFKTLLKTVRDKTDIESLLFCSILFCNKCQEFKGTAALRKDIARQLWAKREEVFSWSL